jgi:hypothetical protein
VDQAYPATDLRLAEAMLRRARRAASIRHPNLLAIRDLRTEEEGLRVVSDEDGGACLEALLERGPLTEAEAVTIGLGVLSALRALHRAGLGHGALDPAAVYVGADGRARLNGAGLASFDPGADLVAAGRVLSAALGERARPRLVAAARAIAAGGAGRSAATALMIFGDAAGRFDSRWPIERSVAGLERLAVPAPDAIAATDDGILQPAAPQRPAAGLGPALVPIRLLRRAVPIGLLAAGVLAVMLVASALPALHRNAPVHQAAAAAGPAAKPALPATAPPDAVVTAYYRLAAAHRFDEALALWDEDLRANLPPAQYPDQRFARTTVLRVDKVVVTSQDGSVAIVATDLTESTGGAEWHWVGSWRLVLTRGVWLLDRPDFKSA